MKEEDDGILAVGQGEVLQSKDVRDLRFLDEGAFAGEGGELGVGGSSAEADASAIM